MFYSISGTLVHKEPGKVVLETGGIAYEILIALNTFSALPESGFSVKLYTHLIIREDGMYLYGFLDEQEKRIFLLLNTVSKVGPKLSLAVLSGISTQKLKDAILSNDYPLIATIPGIGKKTAERIVLELRDKFDEVFEPVEQRSSAAEDVLSALANLGYKRQDCKNIVTKLSGDYDDFETLLKESLKKLSK
ncbi:MAG TPA: Holliday junction branch migration protein RuvA [Flexistipes sinusarabici]|uniref:Holliday junction branch migration complex subunit RuvA n=1 Tax=Flexistipes sinusarabici TaxID=2352 RepID=A0A3D5QD10_FLESI|nr:Holliday junction branch migration protein RuvA [Flexistipes sinusarabici]